MFPGTKKCNIAFFSDTVEVRAFKLCMIKRLLRIYVFIVVLMTLSVERSQCQKYKVQLMHFGFFFKSLVYCSFRVV